MKYFSKQAGFVLAVSLVFSLVSCQDPVDTTAPTVYAVTVSSSIEHGSVSVDKTTAEAGTTIKLTANADDGYKLDSYSVKDSSANSITVTDGTFTMPESNVTVSATFKAVSQTVPVVDDTPETPKETDKPAVPDEPTATDKPVTTEEPVTKDEADATDKPVTPETPPTTDKPVTPETPVTPEIPEVTYYTVTIENTENGSVTASKISGIAADETVTLTVTPAEGYKLASITANEGAVTLSDEGNTRTFTMPQADVTVTAAFEEITYTITIANSENGSVTASKISDIAAGETITLTVTPEDPDDGDCSLSSISVKNGDTDVALTNYTFTMPAANVTVTAVFTKVLYNGIGSKKPSKAKEVGDIVFNDGSATPYTAELTLTDEQKAAAIAVIFYKGTDLNSGDDTTTSRTLGFGLKHTSGLEWCRRYEPEAVASDKLITTIQCVTFDEDGNYIFLSDKNGSDNLEQIADFLGEEDDTTGEFAAYRYPAFYFAKNYSNTATNLGDTYKDGWYLPSMAELFQIYTCRADAANGFDVDAASEVCGGDKFATNAYWSSSQTAAIDDFDTSASGLAGVFSFSTENWWDVEKNKVKVDSTDDYFYVCCIREFN